MLSLAIACAVHLYVAVLEEHKLLAFYEIYKVNSACNNRSALSLRLKILSCVCVIPSISLCGVTLVYMLSNTCHMT